MSDIPYPVAFATARQQRAHAQICQERVDAGKVDRTDLALASDLIRKPFKFALAGCVLGLISTIPLLKLCKPCNRSRLFRTALRMSAAAAGTYGGLYVGLVRTMAFRGRGLELREIDRLMDLSEELESEARARVRRDQADETRRARREARREVGGEVCAGAL